MRRGGPRKSESCSQRSLPIGRASLDDLSPFWAFLDDALGALVAVGAGEGIGENDIASNAETMAPKDALGVAVALSARAAEDGTAAQRTVGGGCVDPVEDEEGESYPEAGKGSQREGAFSGINRV